MRVITFSSYIESSKPLFQKLDILNVNQLNNKQTISFLWLTYLIISCRIILEIFTFWIVNFIRMLHGEAIIYIRSFTEQTTAIIQYSVKGRNSIPDDLRNTSFPSTNSPQLLDTRNEACWIILRSLRARYSIKTFSVFLFATIKLIEACAHEAIAIVSHDMK